MYKKRGLYVLRVGSDAFLQKQVPDSIALNSANTGKYLYFQILLNEMATYDTCNCVLVCNRSGRVLGSASICSVEENTDHILETGNDYLAFLQDFKEIDTPELFQSHFSLMAFPGNSDDALRLLDDKK